MDETSSNKKTPVPSNIDNPVGPNYMPPLGSARDPAIQAALDEEHLRLLKLGYFISGAVTAVFSCFFIFHFLFFLFLGLSPNLFNHVQANGSHGTPPPPGLFLGFAFVVGLIMVLGWTFGALQAYAGQCISRRKSLLLIQVVAALECVFIPWGTFIGVMTFMVLSRPGVRALFD